MPVHALTDYLSLLIGVELYLRLSSPSFRTGSERAGYLVGALAGAIVGSRGLALLNDPSLWLHGIALATVLGNKTIIGALVGGILGIEAAKHLLGIKRRTGDNTVIPLMIANMIGRIGCQLTGVSDGTIGAPCDWAWCFRQGDAFARHPLPLYEIAVLLAFLPFAYRAYRRRIFAEGVLFRLFVIGYTSLRFFLEFLKEGQPTFFSLTVIQMVCLAAAAFYSYDVARNPFFNPVSAEKAKGSAD